jgi:hypothetical protein
LDVFLAKVDTVWFADVEELHADSCDAAEKDRTRGAFEKLTEGPHLDEAADTREAAVRGQRGIHFGSGGSEDGRDTALPVGGELLIQLAQQLQIGIPCLWV